MLISSHRIWSGNQHGDSGDANSGAWHGNRCCSDRDGWRVQDAPVGGSGVKLRVLPPLAESGRSLRVAGKRVAASGDSGQQQTDRNKVEIGFIERFGRDWRATEPTRRRREQISQSGQCQANVTNKEQGTKQERARLSLAGTSDPPSGKEATGIGLPQTHVPCHAPSFLIGRQRSL